MYHSKLYTPEFKYYGLAEFPGVSKIYDWLAVDVSELFFLQNKSGVIGIEYGDESDFYPLPSKAQPITSGKIYSTGSKLYVAVADSSGKQTFLVAPILEGKLGEFKAYDAGNGGQVVGVAAQETTYHIKGGIALIAGSQYGTTVDLKLLK